MTGRILLTGGLGYIGSHTYVALVRAGYDVVVIDNLSNAKASVAGRLAQITNRPTDFRKLDILDRAGLEALFHAEKFDAVVHFAGLKAVGESVSQPLRYFDVNVTGLSNVLSAMQANDVGTIVFSSSATVYGGGADLPFQEDAPTSFSNPYAHTKLTGEQILNQISSVNAKFCAGILRYFNPVGAHASGIIGEDPNDIPNNLMPYIAKVASRELPHLQVFGDDYDTPDGTGIRDYIHVDDLARGHVLSLNSLLHTGRGHTVNLGTGRGYSVREVLAAYGRACGWDLPYEIAPRRAGDIAEMRADITRAAALLGFEAEMGLDEMCASSWHWITTGAQHA
ncbi:UDP-glucose 4-epimerase [Amylibacter marinus]|uniref:UDP-glucose 4-epimerase n=1 Tax=Amylibacter marinus TaxID=1475483 RepID=A0ABQ5VU90_9RHOB|nr:UDP-glucose 4-epimerase GalE [Amylibacter marinus]GLQ35007.1 UDP-glucose 4-epimerase [Amylibacter marinus]